MEKETIFHKIIKREIPAEIVFEDEMCIAIRDINPQAPLHLLVIPKQTVPSLNSSSRDDSALLGHLLFVTADLARASTEAADGYRVVINTGKEGGQTVDQLHLHLLAGRNLEWPPG